MATVGDITAPSTNTVYYDALLTTTLDAYVGSGSLFDNIFKDSAFLAAMRMKDAIQKQNARYSGKGTRLYRIWEGIKSRTQNPNDKDFHHYGARGIEICRQWSASFKRFEAWAQQNGYTDELTIDRIDNEKGYSPENCQWASIKDQANNRRTNVLLQYKGEEKTLRQWCDELNLNYQTMYSRICRGKKWGVEKAFESP